MREKKRRQAPFLLSQSPSGAAVSGSVFGSGSVTVTSIVQFAALVEIEASSAEHAACCHKQGVDYA